MSVRNSRECRIGIVGLGTAGRLMIPAIQNHPGMRLVAVADSMGEVAREVAHASSAQAFEDIDQMLRGIELDAVYIATPTSLHARHAASAFEAGKHVLCEKPMAKDLGEAAAMVEAAAAAGVVLLIGHSKSYDAPFQKMREIIAGGTLGPVRMINHIAYTDWIYRPRRADELDPDYGGGVIYRQGAHQFDVIRLLGGGLVTSVGARLFDWDPRRPAVGAHTATLTFADGTVGTAIYNGYGAFSTAELNDQIDEAGFREPPEVIGASRRAFNAGRDEVSAKRKRASRAVKPPSPHHSAFGLTLVSCERGDLRQSPDGVYVYSEMGRLEITLPLSPGPRDLVIAEFYDAFVGAAPPLRDGRWGLANLEVCVAAVESARSGTTVALTRQCAVPLGR